MTDEQLAVVRRYTSAEVVKMLNIPGKWLRELVRERRVPHQRTGLTKGVWFTAEDVLKIGEMLPELMAHRRSSGEVPTVDVPPDDDVPLRPAKAEPTAQLLAQWAQLAAQRPRPRRTRD